MVCTRSVHALLCRHCKCKLGCVDICKDSVACRLRGRNAETAVKSGGSIACIPTRRSQLHSACCWKPASLCSLGLTRSARLSTHSMQADVLPLELCRQVSCHVRMFPYVGGLRWRVSEACDVTDS